LGFQVLPIYNGLRAAIEWFVARGYAPPFPRQTQRVTL
jgi:dihydroflavonol-4-reductase